MRKQIHIQTQPLDSTRVSIVKTVGWVAINTDNIKIIIDAYHGSPSLNQPRAEALVRIVDDRMVRELTPTQLLDAVKFYEQYSAMGTDIASYKNVLHRVMPDRHLNALNQSKKGLKF